jgi:hypothetical protein
VRPGSCTPAPAREEHGHFALTGPGGIKALRALVLASAEWGSDAVRDAAAAAEAAAGDPFAVVNVLRNKCGRDMGKAHLLLLCHTWGYRSVIWCVVAAERYTRTPRAPAVRQLRRCIVARRVRRVSLLGSKRQRSAVATAPAHAAAHKGVHAPHKGAREALAAAAVVAALAPHARLPSSGALDRPSVDAYIGGELTALLTHSATLLTGPRAEALAASGDVVFTEASLQQYRDTAVLCAGLELGWHAAGAAQRRWREHTAAAVSDAGAPLCTAAAWTLLPYSTADEPAEAVLRQLRALLTAGERVRARVCVCELAEAVADGRRELNATFAAVAEEYAQSLHAGLAFVHAALLLIAQLRASVSFDDYAAAGERLIDQAARYAAAAKAAYVLRTAWSLRVQRAGVRARQYLSDQGVAIYQREMAMLRAVALPQAPLPLCS